MNGLFSLLAVAFILLIAYWWANQGLFSAILHCVCVILAGALAFAFWEPVVLGYTLKGSLFDNYSWGMVLGLLFFLFLVIFRIASDIFIPFDIPLPSLANTIGGGIVGFIAGVLTIGMASISCGFIQAPTEIMGFIGWARSDKATGAPTLLNSMLIPSASITENFYGKASRGSLAPTGKYSLATLYPNLADTALSLHRDTFQGGDARTSIAPKDLVVEKIWYDPNFVIQNGSPGAYAVKISVETGAYDGTGEQFILSSAQARISNTDSRSIVVYPTKFHQPMAGGTAKIFTFDDTGNYATSLPGEQNADIVLLFPAGPFENSSSKPNLFYIKGLRFLCAIEEVNLATTLETSESSVTIEQDSSSPDGGYLPDVSNFVIAKNSIRPVMLNVNLADPMTVATKNSGNWLSGGIGVFQKGSSVSYSKTQKISGFNHSDETEVIMVDASRIQNGIDMWGDRSKTFKELGNDVSLELVDSNGKFYKPVGYVWERLNDIELCIQPSKPFQKISDLPSQPSSGEQRLQLIFIVPTNTIVVGIRKGKSLIGTCSVTATAGRTD